MKGDAYERRDDCGSKVISARGFASMKGDAYERRDFPGLAHPPRRYEVASMKGDAYERRDYDQGVLEGMRQAPR